MKKSILLIAVALSLSVGTASAQASASTPPVVKINFASTSGKAIDTVTNAATEVLSLPVSGSYEHFTTQVIIKKLTGTAAGVVRLYASNDGINYGRIAATDSLIVSNVATQSKLFDVGPAKYLSYRVGYAGSGTQAVVISAVAVLRKRTAL